jgi:hypothetical protein
LIAFRPPYSQLRPMDSMVRRSYCCKYSRPRTGMTKPLPPTAPVPTLRSKSQLEMGDSG